MSQWNPFAQFRADKGNGDSSEYASVSGAPREISPISLAFPFPNIAGLDPRWRVMFKGLQKRDPITKIKALEEILRSLDAINEQSVEATAADNGDKRIVDAMQDTTLSPVNSKFGDKAEEIAILDVWEQIYPKVSIDKDIRARVLSHKVTGTLCRMSGKRFASHLKKVIAPWTIGLFESDKVSAQAASKTLTNCFPGEKLLKAWKIYSSTIIDFVADVIIYQNELTLSDPRLVSNEDAASKYEFLVIVCLKCLNEFIAIDHLSSKNWTCLLNEKKFWKMGNKSPTSGHIYNILASMCEQDISFLAPYMKKIITSVYNWLNNPRLDQTKLIGLVSVLTTKNQGCWSEKDLSEKNICAALMESLKLQSLTQDTIKHLATIFWSLPLEIFEEFPAFQLELDELISRSPYIKPLGFVYFYKTKRQDLHDLSRIFFGLSESNVILCLSLIEKFDPSNLETLIIGLINNAPREPEDTLKGLSKFMLQLPTYLKLTPDLIVHLISLAKESDRIPDSFFRIASESLRIYGKDHNYEDLKLDVLLELAVDYFCRLVDANSGKNSPSSIPESEMSASVEIPVDLYAFILSYMSYARVETVSKLWKIFISAAIRSDSVRPSNLQSIQCSLYRKLSAFTDYSDILQEDFLDVLNDQKLAKLMFILANFWDLFILDTQQASQTVRKLISSLEFLSENENLVKSFRYIIARYPDVDLNSRFKELIELTGSKNTTIEHAAGEMLIIYMEAGDGSNIKKEDQLKTIIRGLVSNSVQSVDVKILSKWSKYLSRVSIFNTEDWMQAFRASVNWFNSVKLQAIYHLNPNSDTSIDIDAMRYDNKGRSQLLRMLLFEYHSQKNVVANRHHFGEEISQDMLAINFMKQSYLEISMKLKETPLYETNETTDWEELKLLLDSIEDVQSQSVLNDENFSQILEYTSILPVNLKMIVLMNATGKFDQISAIKLLQESERFIRDDNNCLIGILEGLLLRNKTSFPEPLNRKCNHFISEYVGKQCKENSICLLRSIDCILDVFYHCNGDSAALDELVPDKRLLMCAYEINNALDTSDMYLDNAERVRCLRMMYPRLQNMGINHCFKSIKAAMSHMKPAILDCDEGFVLLYQLVEFLKLILYKMRLPKEQEIMNSNWPQFKEEILDKSLAIVNKLSAVHIHHDSISSQLLTNLAQCLYDFSVFQKLVVEYEGIIRLLRGPCDDAQFLQFTSRIAEIGIKRDVESYIVETAVHGFSNRIPNDQEIGLQDNRRSNGDDQSEISSDTSSRNFKISLSLVENIVRETDNASYSYLTALQILLYYFKYANLDLKQDLLAQFDEQAIDGFFFQAIFQILDINNPPEDIIHRSDSIVNFLFESKQRRHNVLTLFSLHLLYCVLKFCPSMAKNYKDKLKQGHFQTLFEQFISKAITPILIDEVFSSVTENDLLRTLNTKDISLRLFKSARYVLMEYTIDEQRIVIKIQFPECYPLKNTLFESEQRVGVSDRVWRGWILSSKAVMTWQNGSLVDAITTLKTNIEMHFKGITECSICFAILSAEKAIPNKRCSTCNNKFHGSCLYKWFKSSSSSRCPLCRTNFAFRS